MDPKGTSDPSDGYQLLDKVRLIDLELCELIRDEEEMGQGFSCFPVFKFLLILVDMIDFKLSEEPLPTVNLRMDWAPSKLVIVPKRWGRFLKRLAIPPPL